ncbi:hypothetical protein SUGI_1085220 [Cryptomeria japonica]|uniref:beta-xylosidase/alpha-L-arabinofuranosidase 1 n=1 Tax=Cryptomeria japonica TaxID=3369 RepID=UPI0024149C18|nr:beta-xylosidase/alpha-L-arabinofuranosidase 1 [Cryptomeria japonica]GLJ50954.1 hypothetical protein SUGI_1085220 [Cryptomeria japonica]
MGFQRTLDGGLIVVLLVLGLLQGICGQPMYPCDNRVIPNAAVVYPFCNKALPINVRVNDLIRRLNLKEKVQMLVDKAGAVPRLGIPSYEWWSEALHGVSNFGPGTHFANPIPAATSFPQVILTAATFDTELWEEMGKAVSTEARAMYNAGLGGLTYWSPNVNIFRDPRWGRGQETPGEDPLLTSNFAVHYVRGLQSTDGGDPNRLKVAACCKHFTAYDLDNWNQIDRFHFDARVTQQDLDDTFNPPFKACVTDGHVASVMCSYNKVNGVPTCADPVLLNGNIRGKWGLNGYISSDCDSADVIYNTQHFTTTPERTVADVMGAGLDLNCGRFLGDHTEAAVKIGKLQESVVDRALFNSFSVQMRLGLFDGDPAFQPYGNLGPKDVCTPEHHRLSVRAAREGIVLLKNINRALPFSPTRIRSLAVIGPNAAAKDAMIGNYAGIPCRYTTPVKGLGIYTKTVHKPGCQNVACPRNPYLVRDAAQAASQADATVIVVGADLSIEAEMVDRTSLLLPGYQEQMVIETAKASRGPVILVVMSGGPMDISFAKHYDKITSILWVGYPGQAGGKALADVIFGKHNPGGRLPVTWYPQDFVARVPMTDMNMRPNPATGYPGRTYRFYTGSKLYRFGDGLSYTTYSHSLVQAPKLVSLALQTPNNSCAGIEKNMCNSVRVEHANCQGLLFDVHVDVDNQGSIDGRHAVLLFFSPPAGVHKGAPQRQLMAFRKVNVGAGGRERVHFSVDVCKDLSVVDEMGVRKLALGSHLLHVGDVKHTFDIQLGD